MLICRALGVGVGVGVPLGAVTWRPTSSGHIAICLLTVGSTRRKVLDDEHDPIPEAVTELDGDEGGITVPPVLATNPTAGVY